VLGGRAETLDGDGAWLGSLPIGMTREPANVGSLRGLRGEQPANSKTRGGDELKDAIGSLKINF
jgi:hypothetical protein